MRYVYLPFRMVLTLLNDAMPLTLLNGACHLLSTIQLRDPLSSVSLMPNQTFLTLVILLLD